MGRILNVYMQSGLPQLHRCTCFTDKLDVEVCSCTSGRYVYIPLWQADTSHMCSRRTCLFVPHSSNSTTHMWFTVSTQVSGNYTTGISNCLPGDIFPPKCIVITVSEIVSVASLPHCWLHSNCTTFCAPKFGCGL